MFKKISNNLILFGIVAMSFILTNEAFAASDTDFAFSGSSTRTSFGSDYNDYNYNNNNPYLYNLPKNNYNYARTNNVVASNTGSTSSSQTPTVVNNYYYNTSAPAGSTTSTKTASSSNNIASTTNTGTKVASANSGYGEYNSVPLAREDSNGRTLSNGTNTGYFGASAYGATANRTSASFMPNTIFEWILAVLLILAIVVVYRLILRKKRLVQEAPKA